MGIKQGLAATVAVAALSGCAAGLTFIDRSDGNIYSGTTGPTLSGDGTATATIEGVNYSGIWVYSSNGGGYTINNAVVQTGKTTSFATGNSVNYSAQGNGLINLKAVSGETLRCVFNFNGMNNRGLGECARNDGRLYDVHIKR